MNKNKFITGVIFVSLVVFGLGIYSAVSAYNSDERVAYRAAVAKQKSMQKSCKTIAERWSKCLNGDKEECIEKDNSTIWFHDHYREGYPDTVCPNVYDPLKLGAR